jgi:hypothetical protein
MNTPQLIPQDHPLGQVSIPEPRIITAEDFGRVSISDALKADAEHRGAVLVHDMVHRKSEAEKQAEYQGKPEHRAYVPRKCEMLDRARAEGKKGALYAFKSGTRHGILLNGMHVRVEKKLTKAEKKAAKRERVATRNRMAAVDAEQREES